ncbi:ATP-binding protein [Hymenobacter daecheongensis]|uniref:ATP-binding protein n=1 Tax=Hymenobacter daecheongensis TaxID=496053 RepID=UPI000934CE46|nr:ATP-binding protein [Hymenobacter daecheongensis]
MPLAAIGLQSPLLRAQQTLRQARLHGQPSAIAAAHLALAYAQQRLHNYDQALRHFRAARRLYQSRHRYLRSTEVLRQIGYVQHTQGDTGQARLSYQGALAGFTRLHSSAGTALVYQNMGRLYGQQQKWPQALRSYERALVAWQQLGRRSETAGALAAIGLVHKQQQQYSRALYYLRRALGQGQQGPDSMRVGEALGGIAEVYQALGNQELTDQFYTQALQNLPRATSPETQARMLQAQALAKEALGQRGAAELLLRRALPLADSSKLLLSGLYQHLAALYRRAGNYPQALAALTRYAGLQDTAFAEERRAQVAELQTRYETERKERAIQLLTKDQLIQQANLRRQLLLRNGLAAGALVLLGLAVVLYRSRRQQARANLLLERKNAAISRQKEELSRLNTTKDTLFSIISHDLRSPLSSLYSLLSLLNMGNLPPARLAAHSERLSRTLDSTLRLLDNLLNWSAAQMQGRGVRPEPIRLDALVEEGLTLLLGDAERKKILLLNQMPSPALARADLNMTRLVIRNLLSNAIKFTPENGTVTVSAARVGTWWEVSVADTGIGIAAADYEKVFGAGGLHSTPGTAREKGTGLGLLLCKDFVERNGGRISFESQPGAGTTFRFTLLTARTKPARPENQLTSAAAESVSDSRFAP